MGQTGRCQVDFIGDVARAREVIDLSKPEFINQLRW